jgi:hypothetical protein
MGWKIETKFFSNFKRKTFISRIVQTWEWAQVTKAKTKEGARWAWRNRPGSMHNILAPPPPPQGMQSPLATFVAPSFLRLLLQVNSMTIFFGTFSSLWLTCHCVGVKLGGLAWFFDLTTVLTCRNVIYFRPCIGTQVNPILKKHTVSLSNKLSFGGDPQEFHESLVHWIITGFVFAPRIHCCFS